MPGYVFGIELLYNIFILYCIVLYIVPLLFSSVYHVSYRVVSYYVYFYTIMYVVLVVVTGLFDIYLILDDSSAGPFNSLDTYLPLPVVILFCCIRDVGHSYVLEGDGREVVICIRYANIGFWWQPARIYCIANIYVLYTLYMYNMFYVFLLYILSFVSSFNIALYM